MLDHVIYPPQYDPRISPIYALNEIDVKAPAGTVKANGFGRSRATFWSLESAGGSESTKFHGFKARKLLAKRPNLFALTVPWERFRAHLLLCTSPLGLSNCRAPIRQREVICHSDPTPIISWTYAHCLAPSLGAIVWNSQSMTTRTRGGS